MMWGTGVSPKFSDLRDGNLSPSSIGVEGMITMNEGL